MEINYEKIFDVFLTEDEISKAAIEQKAITKTDGEASPLSLDDLQYDYGTYIIRSISRRINAANIAVLWNIDLYL